MADVSKLQIGSELYNIVDGTARKNASAASEAASAAQEAANAAKKLSLQGFKVAFTEPDTITFTQITED